MFGIAPSELLLLAVVALVVIGPKDLPRVMRIAGQWARRAAATKNQLKTALDNVVRESELVEMDKHWKAENERIMREHPANLVQPDNPLIIASDDQRPSDVHLVETTRH